MEYFTVLTEIGATKIAQATANKTPLKLTKITLGDGNGTVPTPLVSQTSLVNEVFSVALSELKQDENNDSYVVATAIIPIEVGNFWIRELGVFDENDNLIAVGNYPETFKSLLAQGAAKEVVIKVTFQVSSAQGVTLLINPSIVMASQEFVNNEMAKKAEKSHKHNLTYAQLYGDSTKNFNVKKGTSAHQAVNKQQLDDSIAGLLSVNNLLHVQDRRVTHTNGGTPVANDWTQRVLNSVQLNNIAGSSLLNNIVTLPAGKYYIECVSYFYAVGSVATAFAGLYSRNARNNSDASDSFISGIVEVTEEIDYQLEYLCAIAYATYGLGVSFTTTTADEIYADLKIWKVG